MTRASRTSRPVVAATLTALALTLVLVAVPAAAAPKGSQVQPTLDSLVGIVSPGQPGAFLATFDNTGSATITDLGFRAKLSGGTWAGVELPAGCSASGAEVSCVLGSSTGGSGAISLLFMPIASEPTAANGIGLMSLTDAAFGGDASQNNKRAASFDTWPLAPVSASVDTNAEVFGKWQQPHSTEVPFDEIGSDFQRTQVDAAANPTNGYPVFVGHVDAPVACSSGDVVGTIGGFGRAIDVSVNAGGSAIDMTIVYSSDALGTTPATQIHLLHERNGVCVDVPRDCANGAGLDGCFDILVEGRGRNQTVTLQVELPNNGRVKGY
jgi:hypothetical protein